MHTTQQAQLLEEILMLGRPYRDGWRKVLEEIAEAATEPVDYLESVENVLAVVSGQIRTLIEDARLEYCYADHLVALEAMAVQELNARIAELRRASAARVKH